MKATDLMIGDWVYDTILKGNTKVEILSLSGIRGDYHDNVWNEKTFEPIPLTKEILKKNGWKEEFDKVPYMTWYDLSKEKGGTNTWLMWSINERIVDVQKQSADILNHNLCVNRVYVVCEYVHQLQHAMRMCEIDKEILL